MKNPYYVLENHENLQLETYAFIIGLMQTEATLINAHRYGKLVFSFSLAINTRNPCGVCQNIAVVGCVSGVDFNFLFHCVKK